jgi:hypothetical protein
MTLEPEGSPREWPPLGLPTGSIRALLALIVVAVVVHAVVKKGGQLDALWTETLLIALAHYFTSRRFVALSPTVVKHLQDEGILEREHHPLYLPRHTIRLVLLVVFGGLAWWLQTQGRLFEPRSLTLLLVVAAYVLGALVRNISGWFSAKTGRRPSSRWGDLKAILVLLGVTFAAMTEIVPNLANLPEGIDRVALSMLLFYFGSR